MEEKIMMNVKTLEDNTSEFAHQVIEHASELNGLKILLYNLYQEVENGNRFLSTEEAHDEMLEAIFFASNAIGRISKELSKSTEIVGC